MSMGTGGRRVGWAVAVCAWWYGQVPGPYLTGLAGAAMTLAMPSTRLLMACSMSEADMAIVDVDVDVNGRSSLSDATGDPATAGVVRPL